MKEGAARCRLLHDRLYRRSAASPRHAGSSDPCHNEQDRVGAGDRPIAQDQGADSESCDGEGWNQEHFTSLHAQSGVGDNREQPRSQRALSEDGADRIAHVDFTVPKMGRDERVDDFGYVRANRHKGDADEERLDMELVCDRNRVVEGKATRPPDRTTS
ncbi:MAG: hypothetical protein A3I61_19610 [Acidobacteria bacterium RIFCSPLOWO2_02_FULL_68_18]|nr:MAG: hypothetical protein A3I61_19610 [Acidobacteria bacterium RIFCSPLOWO2_02_FULL_68_18]OFW48142.1 MAG: hypothetical protein A3G77_04725 [Acidobacteria bacterium RIFCSPLOWO2_12_FULL_68_19]